MSKQHRKQSNRSKRSRRSFIRNGVEQLESRVLPGGFLDLLAGAAIASNLDLLPEEYEKYSVSEEIEAKSGGFTLRERPRSSFLQSGVSLPNIDREPHAERDQRTPIHEDLVVASASRSTTNVPVAASFIDSFFTSNQFVDTSPRLPVSPSPPPATPSPSFSSPISQLGAGVGSGSGQGYNATGAELPESTAGATAPTASSSPAGIMGEGEGATSASGTASASGSGSGGGAATSSTSTPTPPPPDPCLGIPAPSITIDPVPVGVHEMDVITISGTVADGYVTEIEMGDQWMTVDKQTSYGYSASTWSIEGFYIDDGIMPITVSADYCGQTSVSDTITVQNVAPVIDSTLGVTVDEGGEAAFKVQYSDATNGYGYSAENWSITVDWGDNSAPSVYTDDRRTTGDGGSGTGLGTAPGSYIPLREHTFHHVYEDDAFGDSPTPNETANYPVTVTLTDGADTDIELATNVVNNVAPTVTITSIEVIDAVTGTDSDGNPLYLKQGQLDESEGFIVHGTVTDPGVLDVHTTTIEVDLNQDGDLSDAGETVVVPLTLVSPGNYKFEHTVAQVRDDGPWTDSAGTPVWSNERKVDNLVIFVDNQDDDTGSDAKFKIRAVHNIAPAFQPAEPSFEYEFSADGVNLLKAKVTGGLVDLGADDFHKIEIVWGDGQKSTESLDPGVSAFSVTRDFGLPGQLDFESIFPIKVTLSDDDTDEVSVTKNFSCSDLVQPALVVNGVQHVGGRGQFKTIEVVAHRPTDGSIGAEFGMLWNANKPAFMGKGVCEIGVLQIARTETEYTGVTGELQELYNDRDWHVDKGVPYPLEWFSGVGTSDNPFSVGKLSAQDSPAVPAKVYGPFGWGTLQSAEQEFETCVVAIQGAEGIEALKLFAMDVGIKKMAVYGCITWGYTSALQADGSYEVTRTLMGNSTDDDTVFLMTSGGGQGPSQTFKDVVNDSFDDDPHLTGGGP